jgi:integrase
LHRPSGKAYCRVGGKCIYLGDFDTPESRRAYARILAELAAAPLPSSTSQKAIGKITVVEICAAYLDHCQGYYRKNGSISPHVGVVKLSLRPLKELYQDTPAVEFGPRALKSLQNHLVEKGHARVYINDQIENIKRLFRWATSEELIPPSVFHALQTVPGLRKGRTAARETEPIGPVADDVVNATLPHLSPIVADMVRIQRLTGCRPGEVAQLRPMDVNRSGGIWEYRPSSHKTQHYERSRIVFLGPQAQSVLSPYLERPAHTFCFSPAESEAIRHVEQRAKRKTPVQPSQRNRRKARPRRKPAERYGIDAYRRAISRAVQRANETIVKEAAEMGISSPALIPAWSPNQLRHSCATAIRREFGLEAAQVILGHSKADVTQIYAERDAAKALEVIGKIG